MSAGAGAVEDPRPELGESGARDWPGPRAAWGIVAAITLIGLIPRLIHLDNTYVGDELSTLYLVHSRSLGDVLSSISSDAEISPPLYFVLGWAFSQLGNTPDLVRMPSFLAGIAVMPLSYMVGARMLSRQAGLVAAAAMALNPFVIFYSTDGRAYMVAMALLLATTLSMLIALEDGGRKRWWVAYSVLTALCMYTHYTAAFVLGAQLLWLLWFHRDRWKPALIANAGAVVLFAPWIPSMRKDFQSPTIDILSDLQGDGFDVKRQAVESWAFGYPYNLPQDLPGNSLIVVGTLSLALAALAGLWRWIEPRVRGGAWPKVSRGVVLALMLALATPVAELVLLGLGGSDLFGARNLNTAAPGFALSIGALVTAAGPIVGVVCCIGILGVFGYGAVRSTETKVSTINLKAAAHQIDADAGPDDVVLDLISAAVSPVPLTALDTYLPQTRQEFVPYLPDGPTPFIRFPPPAKPIVEEAVKAAEDSRLFIVSGPSLVNVEDGRISFTLPPANPNTDETETLVLPKSWKVVDEHTWEGLSEVRLLELQRSGDARK